MNGIRKKIDELGRVVVPMKFRKELGLKTDSSVWLSMVNGEILLSPVAKTCALCGAKAEDEKGFRLCAACIEKIKNEA